MKGGRSKADAVGTDSKLKSKGARAGKRTAKPKAAKDPNKPKRPPSAFFVFIVLNLNLFLTKLREEFRKQFKEAHPNNKSVATVGKAAGEKWKSMSEDEKAPFVERAEKRKSDYNKNMQDYNKQLADGVNAAEENESDKSKSEVNDEDDEEGSGEEEDDD
ncbi:High mobility group B protein 4 [Citrus sinensis]|uniref:High mobility group B protein 4 n=1 Tax=Citrus sinensis TaxID=2711 RepID=A0ACB8J138_CITSI|nr:High mobility group B protein 4 [Citrus sinensis]